MIQVKFQIKLTFDEYVRSVDEGLQTTVELYAIKGMTLSQEKVPVLTSATQKSHYVVSDRISGLTEAMASAKSVKPEVQLFDDIETPRHLQAFIVVATSYAAMLEFGGTQSRSGQRPYLTPSVDEISDEFVAACSAVCRNGGLTRAT